MKPNAVTEAAILSRVGARSFSRGKRYHEQGAIVNPRLEGSTLRARCWGSAPRPYQLWILVGSNGIIAGDCSCPVGDGGYCKHVAALLLTWLHSPDSFQASEPLAEALDRREKADLILLIRQMIARHPDLEELVDLYPSGASSATTAADPDLIRRRVEHAFASGRDTDDYYGAAAGIADELESIMQQANIYRDRGAWVDAATVYRTVLDELQRVHAEIYDHEGDLNRVLWEGSERLGECLPQIAEPEARQDVLRTLVGNVMEDIDIGGYGFSNSAYDIVLNQATAAEKAQIVSWVEGKIEEKGPSDSPSAWKLGAYGGFLLDLQAETLTDDEFIDLCRRTGRYQNLVERLLQLERVDEAVASTASASDYELLSLADLFVAHGHDRLADDLIWERAGTSNDSRLDKWLKQQALARGDWGQAIEYASNQFRQRPRLEVYLELKEIAAKLGDWLERRERLLSTLAQNEDYALLTRIHLSENDVDAALTTLPQVRYGGDLGLEVAQAAEARLPREAIRLYREKIDRLIAARGRGNYAQAAVYLTRVKRLYSEELQEPSQWQEYIEALRNHKPRLPALLDELQQAGL